MSVSVRPDDIVRFVPAFLANRMMNRESPLAEASGEAVQGAVLFADISGFTALSESLAARGAAGVEELTQVLNSYFGRMIEVIGLHGGDVVKFAGDAMLAFWPLASTEDLESIALLAARCGLQVQEALKSFTSPTGHQLRLRVGVGVGPMNVVSVGGVFNRWEFVIVGPPVIEATSAAGAGETGWVMLGPDAWTWLQRHGTGIAVSSSFRRLEQIATPVEPVPLQMPTIPEQAVAGLLSFVPAAIHHRLAARQTAWLAEMRRLTILFVNLPEINYHTPLETSQQIMTTLQRELYRFEGSVNKLSTDEKGVTFVAALGLPPLAHEDDAIRGTLAALAIHRSLRNLGWSCSVGVTSGRVFCGTIGSDRRCEFTIIGDIVNLSARLMTAAKGEILCDERTYKAGQDRIEWEVLPPVMLKGKANPVPIMRPLGLAREVVDLRYSEEMVGRTSEQDQVEVLTRRLLDDRTSRVILLEGEAGIGKSTLVANILRRSHRLGMITWLGAALAMERTTPYFLWRAIFRQLFHLDASDTLEEQRQEVLRYLAFDPELAALAPLLDVVLSLDFPPTPQTAAMFGEVRLAATNTLLLRLLARESEAAPLQLILEDCHWLDSASWSLVRQAVDQVPGLLIVLVTRPLPEPYPRDYLPLATAPTTHKLTLGPLSRDESLALVKRRLRVTNIPDAMAELLHAKAQGNPFFLEELTYTLRETGRIRIEGHECLIATQEDLRTLPFPDTVQGVVTSRIDRLAPPEQLTLKVASVIGRTFTKNLLRDVSPIEDDRPHLDQYLTTLTVQSLTVLDSEDLDPAYSFKHVITQEVSYQMMPPAQRKKLHQVVAEWYEQQYRGDLSPYYPLLAKHWSNSSHVEKAIGYLEKAGENAMRDFAHEEAVVFFSQALILDEQTGSQTDRFRLACWQRQLAEAYYNLSDLARAHKHYQIALELLGYPLPRTGQGFVLATLTQFAVQMAHRLVPRWFIGRHAHESAARLEAARAYERLVQIHYLNNAKIPSVHAAIEALNLSETVGECPELARNYSHASVFSGLLLMHRPARWYAEKARVMARRIDQPSCVAYVEFIRGVYWVTVGEWDKAIADLSTAMAITEKSGEKRRWYESGFTLANALSRRGEFRASIVLAEQLHALGTRRSIPQVQVWGLSWALASRLALDPHQPQQQLELALERCLTQHPNVPLADQILGYGILALAYWRSGEKERARRTTESAETVISRTNQISHYLPPAYAGLAEVYTGLWLEQADDPATVREMDRRLRHLCGILSQFSLMYPIGRPTWYLVKGHYHWLRGWHKSARKLWEKSLEAARQYRMPFEEARAHLALAQHLPPDDPRAAAHEKQAQDLMSSLGRDSLAQPA